MQKIKKYLGACLVILISCLAVGMNSSVFAAEETGSITLSFKNIDMAGAQFGLYKMAEVDYDNGNEKYVQTDKFADYEFNFNSVLKDPNASLNQQVEDHISKSKVSTDAVVTVSSNQKQVTFNQLGRGLYFIRLLSRSQAVPSASMTSFLISLPQRGLNESGSEEWNIDCESKMSMQNTLPIPPGGNFPGPKDPTPETPADPDKDPVSDSSNNTGTTDSEDKKTTADKGDKISRSSSTKTGQQTNLWLYLVVGIAALGVTGFLLSKMRKSR